MKKIILLVILYSLNIQCQIFDSPYPGYRFSNFDNTPASDLAKAVKEENIKKISEIIKVNPELIEYQDPIWGMNLLCLSIVNNKREAFKTLLANGANVDGVCGKRDVTTPLIAAINYLDNCDAFFVKELLKNNCDVNLKAVTINEKGLIAEDLPLFSSVDARTNKGEVCTEISRIIIFIYKFFCPTKCHLINILINFLTGHTHTSIDDAKGFFFGVKYYIDA